MLVRNRSRALYNRLPARTGGRILRALGSLSSACVLDLRKSGYLPIAVIDRLAPPGPISDRAVLRGTASGQRIRSVVRVAPGTTVPPSIFDTVARLDRLVMAGNAVAA